MYTTFLEGIPSIVVNAESNGAYMDTNATAGIEEFYEDFGTGNIDAFAISEDAAPGFWRFLERLGEILDGVKYIKCQLTGPFSIGVGLKDEHDRSIIANSAYYDIIKKGLHMKALWMITKIRNAYPGKEVIIFFDEPYMVAFGSAYVSVSRADATAVFDEVLEGLPAKRGVHVCGNTDWPVLLNSSFDIINYDAHGYLDTIFYFGEDLARFVNRDGWMAPGIVPSGPEVMNTTLDSILALRSTFCDKMDQVLPGAGSRDHLYTTSCGVGTLKIHEATRAMELLKALA